MTDFDPSNPTDNSIVSQFPSNERDSRAALTSAIAVEHDQVEGRHSFEVGNTAARDAITTWTTGAMFINTSAGAGNTVIQVVTSVTASVPGWEETGRFTSADEAKLDAVISAASATSAEAEAGTEAGIRAWSPIIVKTAVSAHLPVASAGTMEAATDATVAVTPSVAHRHPSAAKAWCKFDGSAAGPITPDREFNVTDITDNGSNGYIVNFTTAFSDTNYSISVTADRHVAREWTTTARTVNGVNIAVRDSSDVTQNNRPIMNFIAFGDQ